MRQLVIPATGWIFVSVLFHSCSKEGLPTPRPETAAPTVAVARVSKQDLRREEVLAAEFRPFQQIDVHAKVAGYVKKIYVDVGDVVKTGQTLAVLEIPEMADELARVKATSSRSASEVSRQEEEVKRAEAAHNATHLTYTRLASVAKTRPNLIAQQEIDDALARDQSAEAQVSAAKAALGSAREQVGVSQADVQKTQTMNAYSVITAPFSGVVTKRYADTGAMVPAGTSSNTLPVVQLSQNNLLRLVLPVPEAVAARVHVGDSVEVRVAALTRSFTGRVTRRADMVSTATRTMDTQVDVPNPTLTLVPGMYAEAVLTVDRRQEALAVPVGAVAGSGKDANVYLVNAANKIEIRPVRLGLETADKVEVLSGLSAGDMVVTGNRSQLAEGEKVIPKVTSTVSTKGAA